MIRLLERPAATPILLLAISILWSWPLALSPHDTLLAQHFDQYPMAWLAWAAPAFRDGVCEFSAWPDGEPLARLDSFLYLLLAGLLHGAVPGLLLTNLFVLLGPPLSAWAAARLAREQVGADPASALVAGLAFGFAPLAAVAVLEGHVYYLLDPWLPLMALYLLRALDPDRPDRPRAAVLAALCWALCLLTTAYLGVNAALIALAILLWRGWERRDDMTKLWPPLAAFCAACAIVGLAYAALYLRGGVADRATVDAARRIGAATLPTLLAWSPRVDLSRHSLAPAFSAGIFVMALLCTVARHRPDRRWRPWLGLGLLCMALSVGPALEIGVRQAPVPTPLALLPAAVFESFRFPIRLAWGGSLALGLAAAWAAAQSRRPALWLLAAILDLWLAASLPLRASPHPAPVPSLYQGLPPGAILELYPEPDGISEDLGFYQQNLSCYYQTAHGRPILERCLNTDLSRSPRRAAAREIHRLLLDDQPGLLDQLRALRVSSVVLHADLYQPFERAQIISGLSLHLGEPTAEGRDGGEWLLAWRLP